MRKKTKHECGFLPSLSPASPCAPAQLRTAGSDDPNRAAGYAQRAHEGSAFYLEMFVADHRADDDDARGDHKRGGARPPPPRDPMDDDGATDTDDEDDAELLFARRARASQLRVRAWCPGSSFVPRATDAPFWSDEANDATAARGVLAVTRSG